MGPDSSALRILVLGANGQVGLELSRNEADLIGACLVHYSTDYVFDGRKTTPHGCTTYAARRALEFGMSLRVSPDSVTAIATVDYPTPARRPANSRLSTARLRTAFGIQLPDWTHGVDQVLEELLLMEQR